MLADVKSLYAEAEARANTTIKQEEDLNARLLTVSERERVVVEKEQDLQPHHEAVDTRLECELKGVASREAGPDTREATLAEEQKKLEETQLTVLLAVIKYTYLLPTYPNFIQEIEDRCLLLTSSTSFVDLPFQEHRMMEKHYMYQNPFISSICPK
jgi:hypothetical protein